ncbi:MAG: CHAT domain-containing protein [Calothrix sp. C42_A2020_038]|nr:CHAT domain-containing protein [Calothrix sp. C42_A2020_038]
MNVKKILILAANPKDTNKLRLDEEVRNIQAALQRAKNREQFEIITEWAVRVEDLRRALLDHQPTIVHFSGHGSETTGLALENNSGQMQLVSGESLARLFKLFQNKIECVLLNACYSELQASAIHQYIDCVIGMKRPIGDVAAIEFAVGFYDALLAGSSYEDCFEVGCASIDLEGIPESETPVLLFRPRLSPASNKETETQINTEEYFAMSEKKSQPKNNGGISQSVSGGTVHGGMQAAIGNNNQQTMTNQAMPTGKQPTKEEAIQMLAEIEQMIRSTELLADTKEEAIMYLGVAKMAIAKAEPNKALIATNLEGMAETLKNTSQNKIIWEKTKPVLLKVTDWLGQAVAGSLLGMLLK